MRLLQVRCPNCAATVSVAEGAATARCEYCGTTSTVGRRTRFLERRIEPKPPQRANQPPMPVAVQRHSTNWVVWMTLVPLILVAGAGALVAMRTGALGRASLSEFWGGGHPMVADINGDGVGDIIGLARNIQGADSTRLIAYDGTSGDKLWSSQPQGKFGDVQQGKTAISGGVVIHAAITGTAMGFDLGTGAVKWQGVSLGEKAERLCSAGEGQVFVDTADQRRITIATGDGAVVSEMERSRDERCQPLWSLIPNSQPGLTISRFPFRQADHPDALGETMRVDWSLRAKGGPAIALGSKKKGTNIPFIGGYWPSLGQDIDSKSLETRILWTSEVPAERPLDADTGGPTHACIGDSVAYVGYETKDDVVRVAAFEVETGKRVWDVATPKPARGSLVLAGVAVHGERVYVSTWTNLHILDRTSGKVLLRIGTL